MGHEIPTGHGIPVGLDSSLGAGMTSIHQFVNTEYAGTFILATFPGLRFVFFLLLDSEKNKVIVLSPKHLRGSSSNSIVSLDSIALTSGDTLKKTWVLLTRTRLLTHETDFKGGLLSPV